MAVTVAAGEVRGTQRRTLDRCQNGVLWQAVFDDPNDFLKFFWSSDNGQTWTEDTGARIANTSTMGEEFAFFVDLDDYAHVLYRSATSVASYRRGTPNAGRTAWTWSSAVTVRDDSAGPSNVSVSDIVAHREGTGWKAHAVTYRPGGSSTDWRVITITSGESISVGAAANVGGGSFFLLNLVSVDFNHTGDGKTVAGGTPHLYFGGVDASGKPSFAKAVYSGGSWTFNDSRLLTNDTSWAVATSIFDGTRVLIFFRSSTTSVIKGFERDAADTTTTTRDPAVLSDGVINALSVTYDTDGNIYLFAVGATSLDPKWIKFTRSGTSWGSWTAIEATSVTSDSVSAKRGQAGQSVEVAYEAGGNVRYDRTVVFNTAPNAPTLVAPVGAAVIDRTADYTFDWDFSDPDAGDSQSAYDLRYRIGAGSWTDLSGTTPNTYRVITGGTFATGDYEWQVRTTDAAGLVGPYSTSGFFTAASPPSTPTITAPTAGSTISTGTGEVEWSTPSQTSYQVRKVADSAGSPDTGTVYYDSGEVIDAVSRIRTLSFPTNSRFEHLQVRIKSAGLWSAWASVRVEIDYTPPATPVATATAGAASIAVTATHPAPTGSEPTVTAMDVYRREVGDTDDGIRVAAAVAPAGTFTDWAVASGVAYEYRVEDLGDNGTSAFSPWDA